MRLFLEKCWWLVKSLLGLVPLALIAALLLMTLPAHHDEGHELQQGLQEYLPSSPGGAGR